MNKVSQKCELREIVPGLIALSSSMPIAYIIHLINSAYPDQKEKAVLIVGMMFIFLLFLPPAIYLFYRRNTTEPGKLGMVVLATVGVLLVSFYLYWSSVYVFFPADTLLWSESDFVNDILKFRLNYPIYSAEVNNESFVYTPGAQILTYLLGWLLGNATSIPLWRMIQLGYLLCASIVGVFCCCRIVDIALPAGRVFSRNLWFCIWLPIFFLISTNSLTNAYMHNLHNDALALLISTIAYWLLVEYVVTRKNHILILMAIVPAIGFFVKQSLAIWAPLYCFYLLFFDRPLSTVRLLIFGIASFAGIGTVIAACYLLWGKHFIYWIFTAMGNDPISPLRSIQHILDAWAYFAIGLLGGLILLRRENFKQLLGVWLIWLCLIIVEGASSGIGWMLNHMGPGSLIAGIWFLAAMVMLWPSSNCVESEKFQSQTWLHTGIAVTVVILLFNGLGLVRIPVKHLSDDAYRYVKEIEREFQGQPVENILLDAGTWVYLKNGVIMKDRGVPFGNRGYNGTGDFSGMIQRLKEKRYSKILVRNLEAPIFIYDHWLWPKSSGIRKILLENYHKTKKIEAVKEKVHEQVPFYFFDEITILEPNLN